MDNNIDVQDTIAYKIVKELVVHGFESSDVDDDQFLAIYKEYQSRGGSWERLMNGDVRSIDMLEDIISDTIDPLVKVALRISAR